jgi:MFS transporter, PAT family, beta-lactamase induction signal transducer AmpG
LDALVGKLRESGERVKTNRKLLIVSLLYFAEGFPFGIIEQTLPVYFRIHGMSLVHVGLLSLLSLPYALKFMWAPAIDFLGKRRQWIAASQFLMAAILIVLLPLNPADPSLLLWSAIASLAILSATQDIAVDAYTIELLRSSELGIANGFRQAAYRTAMVVSGGIFVAMGGWIGWEITYLTAAGVLVACAILSFRLPAIEVQRPAFSVASLLAPVKDFVARPGVIQVAGFILLYKLGDMAMGPMVRPFWLARGLSTTEIGLITGSLGVVASIAGGLAGGLFMVRYGIFHGLWFLGLWQSLSNLCYVWVAANPESGSFAIYVASAVESFCGGLGTSAFLAFLMSICRKEFSATQYAMLSALFRVTGIIAGALSGLTAYHIGYAYYFALTFVLSLPAFVFIFTVKKWIPTNGNGPTLIEAPGQDDQSRGPTVLKESRSIAREVDPYLHNGQSVKPHSDASEYRSVAPPA